MNNANHSAVIVRLQTPAGTCGYMFKSDLPRFPDFQPWVQYEFTVLGVTSVCLPTVFTWADLCKLNPLVFMKEGSKIEFG